MRSKILRSIKGGLLLLPLLFNIVVAPASHIMAAPGNKGDLKVHEFGTPSGTESNDPKVCAFNIEGFSFDPSVSGFINVDPQGGSLPVGVASGPYSFGPTDASGYAQTQYFNVAGGPTIVNGTYKATLYGKDGGGNINLADEKADSKVFKVQCNLTPTPNVIITPTDPTFVDLCGTANDTYTIPSTTGALYQIAGVTVAAGTYAGSGAVTVTAIADTGYTLTGTTSWDHTFNTTACSVAATPADPTFVDQCGTANDTYTIPSTTGVIYQVSGATVAAGTYAGSGSVTIDAVADAGYTLTGTTSWQHTFDAVACPLTAATPADPTFIDLTCNSTGSYTIISSTGVDYEVNGVLTAAGTYTVNTPSTITITAVAQPGYVLVGPTSWSFTFHAPTGCGGGTTPTVTTQPTITTAAVVTQISDPSDPAKTLVNTGNPAIVNSLAGLFVISSTLALASVGRKNRKLTTR